MTTLVAIQHEDWCVIAAESQSTLNYRAMDSSPVGKITPNGDYLIAAAGSSRGANILAFDWNPPAPRGNLDKFITASLIPSMRKQFIKSGYDIKSDGESASFDNELLIAIKGKIYFIDEAYGWDRCGSGIYASGSGSDFAIGALDALGARDVDNYEDAIEMAEQAVKIASRYDIFSGGLIQIAVQNQQGKSMVTTITED